MTRLTLLYQAFRQAIAFVQRYRQRQLDAKQFDADERAKDREHIRLLFEGVLVRVVDLQKANGATLEALASASIAQSAAFSEWLKSFNVNPGTAEPSTVVTEHDEWLAEQARARLAGDASAFPADLPPEFQLAATLHRLQSLGADPGFDGEGSDFTS